MSAAGAMILVALATLTVPDAAGVATPTDPIPIPPEERGAALIYIACMIVGVIGSAIYSGSEIAVYTMSRLRLLVRARERDYAALIVERELDNEQRLLSTLLIGNNGVNFLTSFGVTGLLTKSIGLGDWASIGVQAAVLTPLLFVFGETVPKEFCRSNPDAVVYRLGSFLRITRWLATAVLLLPTISFISGQFSKLFKLQDGNRQPTSARRRVAYLLHEAVGHGVLSEGQTELVNRALEMRSRRIKSIMVPWPSVQTMRAADSVDQALERDERLAHARYPVVDGSGRVVGAVSSMRLLLLSEGERKAKTVGVMAGSVIFLARDTRLSDAMLELRRAGVSMAVVGTAKRPLGVVTPSDLVEPLIGLAAHV
ncbi:MAG: CNNM domain-containing protein [Phycisphaerales bacterium]